MQSVDPVLFQSLPFFAFSALFWQFFLPSFVITSSYLFPVLNTQLNYSSCIYSIIYKQQRIGGVEQTQTSNKLKLRTNPNFAQTQSSNKPKARTNLNFEQTQTSNKYKFRTNQKVSGLRGTQNSPALGGLRIFRPWGDLE